MKKQAGFKVVLKAIIYNEDKKILVIRRSKTHPTQPLYWDLPGGYLEIGEKLEESIFREIKEETGIKITNLLILDAITNFDEKYGYRVIIYYKVRTTKSKVLLSWEHDDFKWVSVEEFKKIKVSPNCNILVKSLNLKELCNS